MTCEEITIRPGQAGDIQSLVDLLKELFAIEEDFDFNASKQRKGIELILSDVSGQRCIFVADKADVAIGMCSAQILISTAEGGPAAVIEDMAVLRDYRGKGIGKSLLNAVESWAINKGITRLQFLFLWLLFIHILFPSLCIPPHRRSFFFSGNH